MITHGLELGALDLAAGTISGEGYTLSVFAEGATMGEPQAVVREIISMLADGNLVTYDRAGNRLVSFTVEVEGVDGVALQAGESALRRELYRPNTVKWTPPAAFSAPTVFEVITSSMAPQFDDIEELEGRRAFVVSLTCAPFARAASLVTVEALAPPPVTPTTVTIDDCTSATPWTAFQAIISGGRMIYDPITVSPGGGAVTAVTATSSYGFYLTRSLSAVPFTGTRYLVADVAWAGIVDPPALSVFRDGGASFVPPLVLSRATATGRATMVWDMGTTGTVTGIFFSTFVADTPGAARQFSVSVFDISRTDTIPQITGRQQTRLIETGGTERTPASIQIASAYDIADMQVAIVHTSPKDGTGYAPPLRRWRVSGNTVTSAEGDTLSTFTEAIKPTAITCEIPNSALPTDDYVLAVRVRSSVATLVGIDWAVQTFFPSTTTTLEGVAVGSRAWTPITAGVYEIVTLAALTLPTIQGAGGTTRVSFKCLAADADVFWDEAFLFRTGDDCALTVVEHPADHLWLDSPDVSNPVPSVWEGSAANRSDIRHPGSRLKSQGIHVLHPEGTAIFAGAITNQLDVSATYYRRWHSNAAED